MQQRIRLYVSALRIGIIEEDIIMSHHWWLLWLVLLYVILLGFGTYNSLSKALRNKEIHLLEPLRWQIAGHVLVGLAYGIALIVDSTARLSEAIKIAVFVALFVPGMFASIYGKRREQASQSATALPCDVS